MLDDLKQAVCHANRRLVAEGLVTLTWGNVSGISEDRRHMVIKPSGVPYEQLTPDQMVVTNLQGDVLESGLRPSSDTPTHLELYRRFEGIGGIVHTHSRFATVYAQARRPIPCTGTTHADHFDGPIPVTRPLTQDQVANDYEHETGRAIVECLSQQANDPLRLPAVLVAGHAPFTWGTTPAKALDNAVALEAVAEMALHLQRLTGDPIELEPYVLAKHQARKHGPDAYYGQPT
ncbi:L-ribulose-5-phosphate 4-epimerase AraD [Mucisphaera calidilacus]|uniref:L-ribulose-5-phosphate 4-epimerase n=1 Tax=Mucisphaera calidilacus TaxID=2527982 RepID=A0A518BX18_9BACT|nr:L-ribulose-5-phosphate 4-epimerase AraD [Mucisphaera calidilacus]QDU71511.1 L-ribulose-5-phosphate 4-epimerase [Mucisphaera calidilacus]